MRIRHLPVNLFVSAETHPRRTIAMSGACKRDRRDGMDGTRQEGQWCRKVGRWGGERAAGCTEVQTRMTDRKK